MSPAAKLQSGRACIAAACILLLASGMMLCACPGLPALGAGLSIAGIYLGRGSRQIVPFIVLAGCLYATGDTLIELRRSNRHRDQALQRFKQRQADAGAATATNSLPELITP